MAKASTECLCSPVCRPLLPLLCPADRQPGLRRGFRQHPLVPLHENVTVFVEKKQWYIGIANRCKQLQPDNRCGIYLTRPKVCRGYSTDNCDYHGGEYDFELLFTSAEQLERYAAEADSAKRKRARNGKAKSKAKRKPKTEPDGTAPNG